MAALQNCGCPTLPGFGRVGTKSIRLPHPPRFWEGGNQINPAAPPSPPLGGWEPNQSGCPTLPAFGRLETKLAPLDHWGGFCDCVSDVAGFAAGFFFFFTVFFGGSSSSTITFLGGVAAAAACALRI